MATMKFYSEEEALDKVLGEKGTPVRDGYETEMNSFLMGEAIRKARLSKNLTQEQLGDMIGVKRAKGKQMCLGLLESFPFYLSSDTLW